MTCSECGGKLKAIDSVHTPEYEMYRLRRCDGCGRIIYTVEYEIEDTEDVRKTWSKYHRANSSNRKDRKDD